MENENFTFVVCSHSGYRVENVYCNRSDADRKFDALAKQAGNGADGLFVAYYCPSVGGLVNCSYVS